jgi:hypothetical protein
LFDDGEHEGNLGILGFLDWVFACSVQLEACAAVFVFGFRLSAFGFLLLACSVQRVACSFFIILVPCASF